MADVVINGVSYSWSMIQLQSTALGAGENSKVLQGVSALKWNKKRKVENNYGLGGNVIGRGFGNKTCEASITMDYATVEAIRGEKGSLMDLGEFDLIISFANTQMGTSFTTKNVTLKGCFFNEEGFDSKQDDTNITHEYSLNPFDIKIGDSSADGWL